MQARFEKMTMQHQKPIMDIFNHYVSTSTAAFPSPALPEQFYSVLLDKTKNHPAYAIIDPDGGKVIGFCSLGAYNPFSTFRETATISYFIAPNYVGGGLGGQCLQKLEEEAKHMGIKHIIAEISSENEQSLTFHMRHGFERCGVLKKIGQKFDRPFDVVLMQKDLGE